VIGLLVNGAIFLGRIDEDREATYAAVGRALSAWETLEAHLSYLYSIFVGKPLVPAALSGYGRENKVFNRRMTALCKAGCEYIQARPAQQSLESELDALIVVARRLATSRNQIAHGVVQGKESGSSIVYSLVSSSHGVFGLTHLPYSYRVAELNKFEAEFDAHAACVQAFNQALCPKP
jgi:hypothetical protein